MNNIGKPRYGILRDGLFGMRIVSGMVTGVRFTEDLPVYELSFGSNKWWTSEIYDELRIDLFNLPSLEKIKDTHELKIKYSA